MGKGIESEYKFLVEKPETLTEIANLDKITGFRLARRGRVIHTDIYFDTLDLFFYHNDMQCRVRKKNDTYTLTFKTPIEEVRARYDRSEFGAEITQKQIPLFCSHRTIKSENLDMITKVISEHIEDKRLVETLVVETQRLIIDLLKGEMTTVLDLDNILYKKPFIREEFTEHELEIEQGNTPLEHLEEIVSYLRSKFDLIDSPAPKYQRGVSYFLKK